MEVHLDLRKVRSKYLTYHNAPLVKQVNEGPSPFIVLQKNGQEVIVIEKVRAG